MKNVIQSILGTFFFASLAVPVWSLPTDGMAASLREASVEYFGSATAERSSCNGNGY